MIKALAVLFHLTTVLAGKLATRQWTPVDSTLVEAFVVRVKALISVNE